MRPTPRFANSDGGLKACIYDAYRRGGDGDCLASAFKLSREQFWQIIAEGNGGSIPSRGVGDERVA
jgi:hypothetical protein